MHLRSDDDELADEIDESDINKILIVTQTPPALRKHPGGDRTNETTSRVKVNTECYHIINDGLRYYEQLCWDNNLLVRLSFPMVLLISFKMFCLF